MCGAEMVSVGVVDVVASIGAGFVLFGLIGQQTKKKRFVRLFHFTDAYDHVPTLVQRLIGAGGEAPQRHASSHGSESRARFQRKRLGKPNGWQLELSWVWGNAGGTAALIITRPEPFLSRACEIGPTG